MDRKEYSAGAVKLAFWFIEFRKAVQLLSNGENFEDIRRLSREENLFATPTPARARQICCTVITRIKSLDSSFYPIFMESDLATQKIFNLAAVMACDTLFFDFVYEVIREKMIIGSNEFADRDIRVFFKEKQQQNERAAKWTDETLQRLGGSYKTMLCEAGIADKEDSTWKILRPILDPAAKNWLERHDMSIVVKAVTGVR